MGGRISQIGALLRELGVLQCVCHACRLLLLYTFEVRSEGPGLAWLVYNVPLYFSFSRQTENAPVSPGLRFVGA